MTSKELIHAYYKAWLKSNQKEVRTILNFDLKFRSPEENFDSANDFLNTCWKYSDGFQVMTIEHEVYDITGGYVVYSSGDLCCGELLKVKDGKITEIYVTFNPIH